MATLITLLNVAIGLAFVYLLLSLLVSTAVEMGAGMKNWRGIHLSAAISQLLDSTTLPDLAKKVMGNALVSGSSPRPPSYVSARNFSMALFDALQNGSQAPMFSQIESTVAALPPGPFRNSLAALITAAAGDLDTLRKGVETWYDDAMDRLSGSYKRHTQTWAFGIGLALAVLLNVDSITLARTLWADPDMRTAAAAAADQYIKDNPQLPVVQKSEAPPGELSTQNGTPPVAAPTPAQMTANAQALVDSIPVPIGWDSKDGVKIRGIFDGSVTMKKAWLCLWTVIGWMITAAAVSLGSPFWFDMLKDLLNLRNSGPKPARSDATPPAPAAP